MGAFKLFEQSYLSSKLTSVSLREVIFLKYTPCDIWLFQNGLFEILISKGQEVSRALLRELVQKGVYEVYIEYESEKLLQELQQHNLRSTTRALSVGDPIQNGKKQLSLLSINMGYLFKDPVNDMALDLQFQSAKNLINFLVENEKFFPILYKMYKTQSHHYTLSHPLLSSMLLAAFLRYTRHFSNREIELLFLASYFKDIGMSLIPSETFEKKNLDEAEKELMSGHSEHSVSILQGRIPLNPNYLSIIANHHSHNSLINPGEAEHDNATAQGVETLLVVMVDMLTAMTSIRPYRGELELFHALERIKKVYSKDHPREFKYLVTFIQKFYAKIQA